VVVVVSGEWWWVVVMVVVVVVVVVVVGHNGSQVNAFVCNQSHLVCEVANVIVCDFLRFQQLEQIRLHQLLHNVHVFKVL
jgi:hypothetical protein